MLFIMTLLSLNKIKTKDFNTIRTSSNFSTTTSRTQKSRTSLKRSLKMAKRKSSTCRSFSATKVCLTAIKERRLKPLSGKSIHMMTIKESEHKMMSNLRIKMLIGRLDLLSSPIFLAQSATRTNLSKTKAGPR